MLNGFASACAFLFVCGVILGLAMLCQELIQAEYDDEPYDDEL